MIKSATLAAVVLLAGFAGQADAKKISGSGKRLGIDSETKMYPGDDPQHVVTLGTMRNLDNSDDPEFDNTLVRQVGVSDYTAGSGPHWGHRKINHASGDLSFMSYEGAATTTVSAEGIPSTTFEGVWHFTSGTGKYAGISGSGTYSGQVTAEGLSYEWEGEYELE